MTERERLRKAGEQRERLRKAGEELERWYRETDRAVVDEGVDRLLRSLYLGRRFRVEKNN